MPKATRKKRTSKMPPEFDRLLGKLLSTPPVEQADLRLGKMARKKAKVQPKD
jgi:hypothetical protein